MDIKDVLRNEIQKNMEIYFNEYDSLRLTYEYFVTCSNSEGQLRSAFKFSEVKYYLDKISKKVNEDKEKWITQVGSADDPSFYESLFKLRVDLNTCVKHLHFIQQKMSYIVECNPIYFPSVTLYRTKQELKSYNWLKEIFVSSANILSRILFESNEKEFDKSKVLINWSANTEINDFFPIYDDLVVMFNGSYFLINRQISWIIIIHEAFHYLLNYKVYKKNEGITNRHEIKSKFLDLYNHLKIQMFELLVQYKKNNRIYVDNAALYVAYDDIFCDTLLTKIFGLKYYIPVFNELFCSQSTAEQKNLYDVTGNDINWLRLFTAASALPKGKEKDAYEEILKQLKKVAARKISRVDYETFIESDLKLADVFSHSFETVLKRFNGGIKDLKTGFESDNLIGNYISASDYVINNKYLNKNNSGNDLREGRVITGALGYSCTTKKKIEKGILESLYNSQVVSISFIKPRFDGFCSDTDRKKILSANGLFDKLNYGETNGSSSLVLFNLGAYPAVKLSYKDNGNALHAETSLMYFKNEIVGHIIFENHGNDFLENLKNANRIVIMQIRFEKLVLTSSGWESYVFDIKEKVALMFKMDMQWLEKYCIIQTSTWSDFIIVLEVKDELKISDLKKIMYSSKGRDPLIKSTITDICVNLAKCSEELAIETPDIYAKFSSELDNVNDAIDKLKNSIKCLGWECKFVYGIYDVHMFTSDKTIRIQKLGEYYNKLIMLTCDEMPVFSDVQLRFETSIF